ncbi:MAG: HAD-IA family hydrolase [Lachnospiraceae bacterium]|nr:HAD-IA family hydrolase [Lachnospiraceae bacterium]
MDKYNAVIFDLDGTLLNTLEDITDAVNHTMVEFGYPIHSSSEVCSFVGNGIRKLIERSLPDGTATHGFEGIFNEFKQFYTANCRIKTCPYPGIMELLEKLYSEGYKLAINSNKNHAAVTELNNIYFSKYISVAIGESRNIQPKPSPASVYMAMEQMGGCTRKHTLYVGDSDVDIETAKNAGIKCISAGWGFRGKAFLEKLNPGAVIDAPMGLYKYL